jgi:hypothetical protein
LRRHRKAAAAAWLAYLINPEGARTPRQVADAKAVREIENIRRCGGVAIVASVLALFVTSRREVAP